ncbi:ABC transporter permease [Bacillus marasmi]|uniref:ABC transporter permease n=1 Tax=Bacillus marasmi TaxID=1926279 RepID=UPI0011CBDFA6|nr:ABC transporter permease [Bacillus marasmi]
MNNFFIILMHTYLTKLKTKSFLVTSLITVAIIVALTNLPNIIEYFNKNDEEKIAIVDETGGQLFEPLKQQVKAVNSELKIIEFDGSIADAEKAVENGEYKGLLQMKLNNEKLPEATYKAMSITDSQTSTELQSYVQQMKVSIAASQINLTPEQLGKLYEPVSFEQIALEENAKTEKELNQARGLVYVLLFIIYFAVIMYANMIAMEVATEKSSRVMEILISSVSPIKQMFAKILGVGLLSLTQLFLMIVVGYFSINKNLDQLQGAQFDFLGFGDVPIATIVYGVIFFILGYFLYATLAAFLGSLVSRIEDVQQMITPMTMLVVAGFMMAMFGLTQPEATFIKVTSFIPFFAPMLMFLRVGMLNIPVWEAAISIGILVLTIVVLAVFGARVYRGGVLMYGKSSSFKDIKKALQLTKK